MIEVDGLIKRHGSLEVLRGVTLQVARGEVAVIIGPSGGGKSTFLRCLNGLESFQGGSVTVDGLRIGVETPPSRTVENPPAGLPEGRDGVPGV